MMPELDDDDFDKRPTVPRAVPAPLLLELSNDDFERGWVGRRPSFRSLPPPEPVVDAPAPKPRLSPLVWIPMAFAVCGFGALMVTRSLPTTVPTPAAKIPALIETPVEKPAPETQKPLPPPETKTEVAKSEPVAKPVAIAPAKPEGIKPIETKVIAQPISTVVKPIAPAAEKVAVAPKPIAEPENVAAPKPEAPKPAPAAKDEPAPEPTPEPPADPNGGIVNAGF